MATKHTVTDSRGQVHKRTSQSRVYAFAVVSHWRPRHGLLELKSYSHCEWASRRDLAEKVAAGARASSRCDGVEIIEAVRS